jgi:hypothetical protein
MTCRKSGVDGLLFIGIPQDTNRTPQPEDSTMKLCPQCTASPLPFVMIAVIAGVIGFITWLILGLSDWAPVPRLAAAAGACGVVALALWQYVVSCMRRHCRHQGHVHHMTPHSSHV